jgi:2-keto-3-deoxy-6-phosphogluconate aldolase
MDDTIKGRKQVPVYEGTLRSHRINIPACIYDCSGILVFGRRIKSLAFTTDVAIIRNINADAIIAVYPFTPQPAIHRAVMHAADMPVFVGVGGGVTRGPRVVNLANDAEHEGAFGVVVNAPTDNKVVTMLKQVLDIPVVVTVVSERGDIAGRIAAGADILNISGAQRTPEIVAWVRERFPDVPIIATGGPTEETIRATIRAGANAITYTPPTSGELFAQSMARYRVELGNGPG